MIPSHVHDGIKALFLHFTFYISSFSALQSKDNDAAAQLPVPSESPAGDAVNDATTPKPTPAVTQGTV